MNVIQTLPVEIALRTLGQEDRQEVLAWIGHLANWENDTWLRKHARLVNSSDDVYLLKTRRDFCIFFRLEADRIVLLDLTTKATLAAFAHASGSDRR